MKVRNPGILAVLPRFRLLLPLLCLTAIAVQTAAQRARTETRWERSARQKQELTRDVSWPDHEPLIFLLRRGTHSEDQADIYERQHAPENFKRMAAAGVRYGRLHFYKGFGLEYEKPDIEKTKRAAAVMRQLGMKVSLYVAGTMFTETFYREIPEARNWEQRDQNNRWVPYTQTQTFRHYACPNEAAYRGYLKKVLKIGVEEVRADQIMFDNVQLQPEPKSCRCPRCIRAFKDFLRRRYPTKEAVFRRFGLPDVDWIQVNEWDLYNTPDSIAAIDDPVLQEWVRFRCGSMAKHYNELYDYIKGLNPQVSVGLNIKGLYGFNRMWLNGIYHPLYSGKCDFMPFDVSGMEPRIDSKTGALVSEIRSYKMARRLGISCNDSQRDELNAAVHMAFNYQKLVPGFGYEGGPFLQGASTVFTPMLQFFREYYERYFTATDNVADVAVLRTWPSMAYSIAATLVPTILAEQVLIQHKLPFDLLYEEQIDRIDRYGAVILAGQESVSKTQIERLLQYVRNGGSVILTDNTAEYNEWRERRPDHPLLPARREGKGQIVYIPHVRASKSEGGDENPEIIASSQQRSRHLSPQEWVLPRNHDEIYKAIAGSLPKGLSITTEAPLTTVMELLNREQTRETIVHFVNFDRKNRLKPFAVELKKQFAGKVKSVTRLAPDSDDPRPIAFEEASGRIRFTVPEMGIYSMIVVAHE
jgi:hypothetical protein